MRSATAATRSFSSWACCALLAVVIRSPGMRLYSVSSSTLGATGTGRLWKWYSARCSESPKDRRGEGRPGTRSSYWNRNFAGHVSSVSIFEYESCVFPTSCGRCVDNHTSVIPSRIGPIGRSGKSDAGSADFVLTARGAGPRVELESQRCDFPPVLHMPVWKDLPPVWSRADVGFELRPPSHAHRVLAARRGVADHGAVRAGRRGGHARPGYDRPRGHVRGAELLRGRGRRGREADPGGRGVRGARLAVRPAAGRGRRE